jgi:hypothetical protein
MKMNYFSDGEKTTHLDFEKNLKELKEKLKCL